MSKFSEAYVGCYDLLEPGDHGAVDAVPISFVHEFEAATEAGQKVRLASWLNCVTASAYTISPMKSKLYQAQ